MDSERARRNTSNWRHPPSDEDHEGIPLDTLLPSAASASVAALARPGPSTHFSKPLPPNREEGKSSFDSTSPLHPAFPAPTATPQPRTELIRRAFNRFPQSSRVFKSTPSPRLYRHLVPENTKTLTPNSRNNLYYEALLNNTMKDLLKGLTFSALRLWEAENKSPSNGIEATYKAWKWLIRNDHFHQKDDFLALYGEYPENKLPKSVTLLYVARTPSDDARFPEYFKKLENETRLEELNWLKQQLETSGPKPLSELVKDSLERATENPKLPFSWNEPEPQKIIDEWKACPPWTGAFLPEEDTLLRRAREAISPKSPTAPSLSRTTIELYQKLKYWNWKKSPIQGCSRSIFRLATPEQFNIEVVLMVLPETGPYISRLQTLGVLTEEEERRIARKAQNNAMDRLYDTGDRSDRNRGKQVDRSPFSERVHSNSGPAEAPNLNVATHREYGIGSRQQWQHYRELVGDAGQRSEALVNRADKV